MMGRGMYGNGGGVDGGVEVAWKERMSSRMDQGALGVNATPKYVKYSSFIVVLAINVIKF